MENLKDGMVKIFTKTCGKQTLLEQKNLIRLQEEIGFKNDFCKLIRSLW